MIIIFFFQNNVCKDFNLDYKFFLVILGRLEYIDDLSSSNGGLDGVLN